MASKASMKADIVIFYAVNSDMLMECGIKATTWWKWFESFDTHSEYKKLYIYVIKSLKIEAEKMRTTWNLIPGGSVPWSEYRVTLPGDRIVKLLNQDKVSLLTVWRKRPPIKRKAE